MGQPAEQFVPIIGIRRRERDRCEAQARAAREALDHAEHALEEARRKVEIACRSCASAERARAAAPCDTLVADYLRAEQERLVACKQEAALRADALHGLRRDLAAAQQERQRAQVRLDVLEGEHAGLQSRERRRSERKREDALPLATMSPC
jgi:formate-dependent nitrite reductase cytochrome c552 subunit